MKITPELEVNVVEVLKSDPIDGAPRACLLLLMADLADDSGLTPEISYSEIAELVTNRWDELLARALEMASRLEATAA